MEDLSIFLVEQRESSDICQPPVALCLAQCLSTVGALNLCQQPDKTLTSPWQPKNMICNATTITPSPSLGLFLPNEHASIWKPSITEQHWLNYCHSMLSSLCTDPFCHFLIVHHLSIHPGHVFNFMDTICRSPSIKSRSWMLHPRCCMLVTSLI